MASDQCDGQTASKVSEDYIIIIDFVCPSIGEYFILNYVVKLNFIKCGRLQSPVDGESHRVATEYN